MLAFLIYNIFGFIINLILFYKVYDEITLCDIFIAIMVSVAGPLILLFYIVAATEGIVIYKKRI